MKEVFISYHTSSAIDIYDKRDAAARSDIARKKLEALEK